VSRVERKQYQKSPAPVKQQWGFSFFRERSKHNQAEFQSTGNPQRPRGSFKQGLAERNWAELLAHTSRFEFFLLPSKLSAEGSGKTSV